MYVRQILASLLLCLWAGPADAAWAPGNLVLDYGIALSDGERLVVTDVGTVGQPFQADLLWQVDPGACRLQTLVAQAKGGVAAWADVPDDGWYRGHPAHAMVSMVEGLAVVALRGQRCEIGARDGEFVSVSTIPQQPVKGVEGAEPARIGASVLLLRATAFYLPREVRVKAGDTVVWFYADGSQEPHTVTSGACRGADCSGGGQLFGSGPTLLKPGDRFAHTFTRPGTYPYHCNFHTATMQGTVIVSP